jgi:orotidine-5'-phosphate decarboxylase
MKTGLIIALDLPCAADAMALARRIGGAGGFYKIGLELFIAGGGTVIPALKDMGKKIFLDLKLHDIPNTVRGAVLSSLRYGADIIDVHIQGGREMLSAAAETCREYSAENGTVSKIIGVTLLTSLSQDYLAAYGISGAPQEYVLKLAKFAQDAGLDGVVSSAGENRGIKDLCGASFITVTPGMRFASGSLDDQKRAVTPYDAVKAGADYIVVGRPITRAEDPLKAAELFQNALEEGA